VAPEGAASLGPRFAFSQGERTFRAWRGKLMLFFIKIIQVFDLYEKFIP
jgi:hypothetical protein